MINKLRIVSSEKCEQKLAKTLRHRQKDKRLEHFDLFCSKGSSNLYACCFFQIIHRNELFLQAY